VGTSATLSHREWGGLRGLAKGLGDGFVDGGDVFAGGDFGDDAAVLTVSVDLGGDDAAEDLPASDDGDGGFIAAGFDGEDSCWTCLLGALIDGLAGSLVSALIDGLIDDLRGGF